MAAQQDVGLVPLDAVAELRVSVGQTMIWHTLDIAWFPEYSRITFFYPWQGQPFDPSGQTAWGSLSKWGRL